MLKQIEKVLKVNLAQDLGCCFLDIVNKKKKAPHF